MTFKSKSRNIYKENSSSECEETEIGYIPNAFDKTIKERNQLKFTDFSKEHSTINKYKPAKL